MKKLKSVLFVSDQRILIHQENDHFLIDILSKKVLNHFNGEMGIEVFRASLSPNRKWLILSNDGGEATLWNLASNEVREMGIMTLNAHVLGWLDNDRPIFAGAYGGAGTIRLPGLLKLSREELEQHHGWYPGYTGLKYYGDELHTDEMVGEVQVDYFTSDLWDEGNQKRVIESIEGDNELNLYTVSDEISHEVKRMDVRLHDNPRLFIVNNQLVIVDSNCIYLFDLQNFELITTHLLESEPMIVRPDLERNHLYTYEGSKLEKWDLETGETQLIWSGTNLSGFTVSKDHCAIYKDRGTVEIFDLNAGRITVTLEVSAKKGNPKVLFRKIAANVEIEAIRKLLESEKEKKVEEAFNRIKNLPEAQYQEIALLAREYPFHCLAHELELSYFQHLKKLDLSGKDLYELSPMIGQMIHLQELNLSSNSLNDLPSELGSLMHLKQLDISFNEFTALPDCLEELSDLKELNAFCNNIVEVPEWIGQLTQLEVLVFNTNQITTLPNALTNLVKLYKLDLKNNYLTTLPADIGKLSQLTHLLLEKNEISILPDSLYELFNLEELDLYNNKIVQVSEKIQNLRKLARLMLYNNELIGFPDVLSSMEGLRQAFLGKNSIPKEEKQKIKKNIPKGCRIDFT